MKPKSSGRGRTSGLNQAWMGLEVLLENEG